MKLPRLALLLPAFVLLSACSQHPRSLVGVWRGADAGQLVPNTILVLERDGSSTHNRSGMLVVTEGNASWDSILRPAQRLLLISGRGAEMRRTPNKLCVLCALRGSVRKFRSYSRRATERTEIFMGD